MTFKLPWLDNLSCFESICKRYCTRGVTIERGLSVLTISEFAILLLVRSKNSIFHAIKIQTGNIHDLSAMNTINYLDLRYSLNDEGNIWVKYRFHSQSSRGRKVILNWENKVRTPISIIEVRTVKASTTPW